MSFLPNFDREYLKAKGLDFDEVESPGQKGLVIRNYPLPAGRYDAVDVRLLILLPSNYNDAGPDMFYTLPWVKLVPDGRFAKAADVAFDFAGERWQRWSRHNTHWRPGIDHLPTMLARVREALEVAR